MAAITEFAGPAFLGLAFTDPSSSANWNSFLAEETRIIVEPQLAYQETAFAAVEQSTGVWQLPTIVRVQCQLRQAGIDYLQYLLLDSTLTEDTTDGDTLKFHDNIEKRATGDFPMLYLVPQVQAASNEAAEDALWLPKAICENVGDFVFRKLRTGQDPANPYNVGFRSLLDPASTDGQRCGWFGPPAGLGVTVDIGTLDTDAV